MRGTSRRCAALLPAAALAPSANPYLLPHPLPCVIQIKRADAIRYFLLDHFGGLYVDLDFEALRPIDDLLAGHGLVIGQEPYVHSRVLYNVDRLMCNAFMASCPRHPFWATVHAELEARKHITKGGKHVMDATGPRMINDAVNAYEASEAATTYPLFVPDAGAIYPNHDTENPTLRPICQNKTGALSARRVEPCKKLKENNYFNAPLTARSFAVHHWQHSWVGFGYFEVDTINSTKLVADVRAGRTTTLDQAYAYGQEYEGDGVWGGDWDGIPSITGECEADKAKLCADVKPGGHRTHLCLDKARADKKLSPECADSATFRRSGSPPPTPSWSVPIEDYGTPSRLQDEGTMWTPDMILGITEECEADKKRLCADVKPGNHRTHTCLEEAKAAGKLAEACAKSGTFVQGSTGAQVAVQPQQQAWRDDIIIPGISEACEADKKKLCADTKPGNHRTHKCLEEAKAAGKLAAACAESTTFARHLRAFSSRKRLYN